MDEIGSSGSSGRGSASRQRAGAAGERRTAELLRRSLKDVNSVVVHSVKIPFADRADMDHVVITSNLLLLIDSKLWRSGLYWNRSNGSTMRNFKAFPEADKRTMGMARDKFARNLPQSVKIQTLLLVHTNAGKVRLGLWQAPEDALAATPKNAAGSDWRLGWHSDRSA